MPVPSTDEMNWANCGMVMAAESPKLVGHVEMILVGSRPAGEAIQAEPGGRGHLRGLRRYGVGIPIGRVDAQIVGRDGVKNPAAAFTVVVTAVLGAA